MKKILLILCALFVSTANADVLDNCLKKIESSTQTWQDILSDTIFNYLDPQDELTSEIIQNNRQKIYSLLAKNIEAWCAEDIAQIIKVGGRKKIFFTYKEQKYGFDFDLATALDYANDIRTGILVMNNTGLSTKDIVNVSDFPEGQKFFSDECSDNVIWDNLDNDAAVNIAGQSVFNEFGGSKHEFFLDFAEGDNRRAFPGLVLMDKTGSTKEQIVSYVNPSIGLQRVQQFAEKLRGGACSNQRLAVYLVALDVKKDTTNSAKDSWAIGLVSGAGAGVATAAIALFAGAGAATVIPVVGWITAGVLVTAGAIVSLTPAPIEDIQQVMILDGPYIL